MSGAAGALALAELPLSLVDYALLLRPKRWTPSEGKVKMIKAELMGWMAHLRYLNDLCGDQELQDMMWKRFGPKLSKDGSSTPKALVKMFCEKMEVSGPRPPRAAALTAQASLRLLLARCCVTGKGDRLLLLLSFVMLCRKAKLRCRIVRHFDLQSPAPSQAVDQGGQWIYGRLLAGGMDPDQALNIAVEPLGDDDLSKIMLYAGITNLTQCRDLVARSEFWAEVLDEHGHWWPADPVTGVVCPHRRAFVHDASGFIVAADDDLAEEHFFVEDVTEKYRRQSCPSIPAVVRASVTKWWEWSLAVTGDDPEDILHRSVEPPVRGSKSPPEPVAKDHRKAKRRKSVAVQDMATTTSTAMVVADDDDSSVEIIEWKVKPRRKVKVKGKKEIPMESAPGLLMLCAPPAPEEMAVEKEQESKEEEMAVDKEQESKEEEMAAHNEPESKEEETAVEIAAEIEQESKEDRVDKPAEKRRKRKKHRSREDRAENADENRRKHKKDRAENADENRRKHKKDRAENADENRRKHKKEKRLIAKCAPYKGRGISGFRSLEPFEENAKALQAFLVSKGLAPWCHSKSKEEVALWHFASNIKQLIRQGRFKTDLYKMLITWCPLWQTYCEEQRQQPEVVDDEVLETANSAQVEGNDSRSCPSQKPQVGKLKQLIRLLKTTSKQQRRQILRRLQLQLHPDKNPEGGEAVRNMFDMVQKMWEKEFRFL